MIISNILGILSRIRGKRIFHPAGIAYKARFEFTEAGSSLLDINITNGYDATVRFSRAIGLPPALPDFHGLAIRIAIKEQTNLDLLMVTSGAGTFSKYIFLPAKRFLNHWYSSGLRYQAGDKNGVFMVRHWMPGNGPQLYDDLEVARKERQPFTLMFKYGNRDIVIGTLILIQSLSPEESTRLRYNIWNTIDSVQPLGWINRLRREVYIKSQKGRGGH